MTRFNYNDDEFQDENLFPDTEDDDYYMKLQENFHNSEIGIARTELNQRLLRQVIKMCESQADWASKSHRIRLRIIAESYDLFSNLTSVNEEMVN